MVRASAPNEGVPGHYLMNLLHVLLEEGFVVLVVAVLKHELDLRIHDGEHELLGDSIAGVE
jgi:hypothetical protein